MNIHWIIIVFLLFCMSRFTFKFPTLYQITDPRTETNWFVVWATTRVTKQTNEFINVLYKKNLDANEDWIALDPPKKRKGEFPYHMAFFKMNPLETILINSQQSAVGIPWQVAVTETEEESWLAWDYTSGDLHVNQHHNLQPTTARVRFKTTIFLV